LIVKSVLAGGLAVIMDLAIEQVAMKYDLWQWENGAIPVFNYLCWFIFGGIFAFLYFKNTAIQNITGRYLFWIWGLFFFILTII
jgi:putative membrane protein